MMTRGRRDTQTRRFICCEIIENWYNTLTRGRVGDRKPNRYKIDSQKDLSTDRYFSRVRRYHSAGQDTDACQELRGFACGAWATSTISPLASTTQF